mmetsp:Transcript_16323/g.42059  ORF Transcript_16323/g.42059 Transcript_16323/m.42059 type:complete len:883 (-) Transcript_16323:64-2712(-)
MISSTDSSVAMSQSVPAFTIIRPVSRQALPTNFQRNFAATSQASLCGSVNVCGNEAALLNLLLAKLVRMDPDVIMCHDFLGFGLDILSHRLAHCRTKDWSRLGRLVQRKDLASIIGKSRNTTFYADTLLAGRLTCDTYISAKDLLPKEKDYSLVSLSRNVLDIPRKEELELSQIPYMFESQKTLADLCEETALNARTAFALSCHLSLIPLSKQLTALSGNQWSRTIKGARAERIEYLLCHELKRVRPKLLLPDKLSKMEKASLQGKEFDGSSKKRKAQYAGGLVLEPKKGLYDRFVLQLDFNSLYPSIIQEFNICFTTISLVTAQNGEDDASVILPDRSVDEGTLPRVLRRLVEQRKSVKHMLRAEKDPVKASQLDTRQLAIKLTANSIYGCLGFENSRFFARPLAEVITLQGRETLQKTIDLAEGPFNARVIYGDTDSIFVYTGLNDLKKVKVLGFDLKKEINKRYRTLEIEVDAVYSRMLLLRKKKYAALRLVNLLDPTQTKREVKGLDIVRHDWCDLSHDLSEFCLGQLLSPTISGDDAIGNVLSHLHEVAARIRDNQIALGKYIITKSITKRLEEYADSKNLPHVQVALRLRQQGKYFRPGDYIKYVICTESTDPSSTTLSTRAYHPDEVANSNGKLRIDNEWYLGNQLLPPITRLFEPIEEVDSCRIASALGLDGRRYAAKAQILDSGKADAAEENEVIENEGDKYKDCSPWILVCGSCSKPFRFEGPTIEKGSVLKSGLECPHCSTHVSTGCLLNSLNLVVRRWIKAYYCAPLLVDDNDSTAWRETRTIRLTSAVTQKRKPTLSERWLYTQLRFVKWLVDPARFTEVSKISGGHRTLLRAKDDDVYRQLSACADYWLDKNAFHHINISSFFAGMQM